MSPRSTPFFLLTSLLATLACDAPPSEPIAAPSEDPATTAALQSLDTLGVNWDEQELGLVPASALVTPDFARPEALALHFTPAPLHFLERRANGRDVFRDGTDDITVKVDASQGYWKIIRNDLAASPGRALEPAEVSAHVEELIAAFGLPADQIGPVTDSPLVSQSPESGRTVIGHTLYLPRMINGHRVLGSYVLATYTGDGEVSRAEVRWPAFNLEVVDGLATPDEAAGRLAEALAEPFAVPTATPRLESELAYELNEQGNYEPVLRVWSFDPVEGGEPELMELWLASRKLDSTLPAEISARP